jgi:hypothetical protein
MQNYKHSRLEELAKCSPELFTLKGEYIEQHVSRGDCGKEIREIVDELYKAEENEKEKVNSVVRSGSPTTVLTTQ